jgi:ABC-type uncharacterized transport system substrate-binding protein
MRRRQFITLIGGAATWPLVASAQQPTRPAFGILLVFSQEAGRTFTEPLRAYMRALGYVEGRNIAFDVRYADGKADRLPALAAELVAQRPAVIATFGDATGLAVKTATKSNRRCAKPKTKVPLGSTCCLLRYFLRYADTSSASQQNSAYPQCINGRK